MTDKHYKTSSVVMHVFPDDSNGINRHIAYIGTNLNDAADFVKFNSESIPKDERYDIYFRCEEIKE